MAAALGFVATDGAGSPEISAISRSHWAGVRPPAARNAAESSPAVCCEWASLMLAVAPRRLVSDFAPGRCTAAYSCFQPARIGRGSIVLASPAGRIAKRMWAALAAEGPGRWATTGRL